MTIKEPMSDTLVDAIRVARLHGDELVRRAHSFPGCWSYRNCPPRPGSGLPNWWVGDNTIHSLIRRGIAVVTHKRVADRPAVVRVKSEAEMAPPQKPVPFSILIDGQRFNFSASTQDDLDNLHAALSAIAHLSFQ